MKVNKNLNVVNVKDCGAVGDNVVDDTAAIQKAINEIEKRGGGTVFFPAGHYKTTKTLNLPNTIRPTTNGGVGFNITLEGSGMYNTGIMYTGTDYAIFSDKDMAEVILFKDFYINHKNGGGIRLPQGAYQMFERFFSSACGAGKYGVLIEGNTGDPTPERPNRETAGYGSYMCSFKDSRFWSETGYLGVGVRLEHVILCTKIDNCFFSNLDSDASNLELYGCHGVHITATAFERKANNTHNSPLIKIEDSYGVSIIDSHAEPFFESFVGIYGNSSNVLIDSCRIDHYGIAPANTQKGYIVSVDAGSTQSKNIIVGKNNYYQNSRHNDAPKGLIVKDPVGCVTINGFVDSTPYRDDTSERERRYTKKIGSSSSNILINPTLLSDSLNGVPIGTTNNNLFTYTQLINGGCKITQSSASPPSQPKIRMYTNEILNKHEYYTFAIVAKNNSGRSIPFFAYIDGNLGDLSKRITLYLPSANDTFTLTHKIAATNSNFIDISVWTNVDIDIYAIYVLPGVTDDIPYGTESLSSSKLNSPYISTSRIKMNGTVLPTATVDYRGQIAFVEGIDANPDKIYVCKRLADNTYAWVEV